MYMYNILGAVGLRYVMYVKSLGTTTAGTVGSSDEYMLTVGARAIYNVSASLLWKSFQLQT